MTESDPVVTEADHADALVAAMVAERGGAESLTIAQLAIIRRCAKALAFDIGDIKDISTLLGMLPPACPQPRRDREPTLEELEDAPVDLERLDDYQLFQLETLVTIGQGRAEPLRDDDHRRCEAALELAALVALHADNYGYKALPPAEFEAYRISISNAITRVLLPMAATMIYPSLSFGDRSDEIEDLRSRLKTAEEQLARSGPNVVDLARRRGDTGPGPALRSS